MVNNVTKIRENIYSKDSTSSLLALSDDELLKTLYKENNVAKEKYKTYEDFKNTFNDISKRDKKKELATSPYNLSPFKKIADKATGILQTNPLARKISANPLNRIAAGTASDLISASGNLIDKVTFGKIPEGIKKIANDATTFSRQAVLGKENVIFEEKDGIKSSDMVAEKSAVGSLTRGVAGFAIPYTGALKLLQGVDALNKAKKLKKIKKLFPDVAGVRLKTKADSLTKKSLQFVAAGEIASQIMIKPEDAFMGNTLGDWISEDRETLQTVLSYVSADKDKTEGENRVALLFDGLFLTGALTTGLKATGIVFKSGKEAFKYFKNIKNTGSSEEKKELVTIIKEGAEASKTVPTPKIVKTDEPKFTSVRGPEADNVLDSWAFSESPLKRNLYIATSFFKSRGSLTQKQFDIIGLGKNTSIALGSKAEQLMRSIDNTIKTLAKDPTNKYNKKELDNLFDNYMMHKGSIDDLPESLRSIAIDTRNNIDELSGLIKQTKYVSPELKQAIDKEIGTYLRTTYKKFEDPNFKPSDEVIEKAEIYIASKLKKYKSNKDASPKNLRAQAAAQVEIILRDAKYSSNYFDYVNTVSAGKNSKVIFAEKQKIATEIQDLLGKQTSTSSRVFSTINTLGEFITRQGTMEKLSKMGKDKYFFDKPIGQFNYEIKGKQFGALEGKYTNNSMAINFLDFSKAKETLDFGAANFTSATIKLIYGVKGFSQGSKTVLNNVTHERNFQSSGLIMLSNGMNPFSAETWKGLKTAWSSVKPTDNVAVNNLYNKYLRLGIVNQNARLGDVKKLLESAQTTGFGARMNDLMEATYLKKGYKTVEKLYVAEDDVWKIAVFEKELSTLKKAYPNKRVSELEMEASRITRNVMPTYDMIPAAFKALRYSPWGNFLSFHAERFRNTFHTYKQAASEIKSSNPIIQSRGWKRLSAKAIVGQSGAGIVGFGSKQIAGVSDEEDYHIRQLMKESYHGSNWIYDTQDKTGVLTFADTKFTDPDSPVNDTVLETIYEYVNTDNMTEEEYDNRLINGMTESFEKLIAPFKDEAILPGAVADVTFRGGLSRDMNGTLQKIKDWNFTENKTFDTKVNNFFVGTKHVFDKALNPMFIENLKSIDSAATGKEDKYGVRKDLSLELFKNYSGFNFKPIDNKNLYKKLAQNSFKFNREKQAASSLMYKDIESIASPITEQDVAENFLKANRQYYIQYVQTKRIVNSLLELENIDNLREKNGEPKRYNLSFDEIKKVLKDRNIPTDVLNNFVQRDYNYDLFKPLKFSDDKFKKLIKMHPEFNAARLRETLNEYEKKLYALPLLETREEYSTNQKETLTFLYSKDKEEPENTLSELKSRYSTGGIVEGKDDVPYTKENPANRVNKYTGQPYSESSDITEQLTKLGLNK